MRRAGHTRIGVHCRCHIVMGWRVDWWGAVVGDERNIDDAMGSLHGNRGGDR